MSLISSDALKRLNVINIFAMDKEKGNVIRLFGDETNPLYLTSSDLEYNWQCNTDDLLWGTGGNMFNKIITGAIQAVSSNASSGLGNFKDFSGTTDLRRKFIFSGSSPQELTLRCLLLNTEGWDKSIKPKMDEFAEWILPTVMKNETTGEDYALGEAGKEALKNEINGWASSTDNTDAKSFFKYLNMGLDKIASWIGGVQFLHMPKQFSDAESGGNKIAIKIGRIQIDDIYISDVKFKVPKTYMINDSGAYEPDRLEITLTVKSMRQTTTSNFHIL